MLFSIIAAMGLALIPIVSCFHLPGSHARATLSFFTFGCFTYGAILGVRFLMAKGKGFEVPDVEIPFIFVTAIYLIIERIAAYIAPLYNPPEVQ